MIRVPISTRFYIPTLRIVPERSQTKNNTLIKGPLLYLFQNTSETSVPFMTSGRTVTSPSTFLEDCLFLLTVYYKTLDSKTFVFLSRDF